MSERTQDYASHRRWSLTYHFVAVPILAINFAVRVGLALRGSSPLAWWDVALAAGLLALAGSARLMALTVQNRLIRLEERLRLARVLPAEMHGEIERLRVSELIELRFAPDEELPDLVRRIRAGELASPDQVKRAVRAWRPDFLRA
jgi:hypothetical protein